MLDTIILLAGAAEQAVFPAVLRAHNPDMTVLSVATSDDLAALSSDLLARSRLIAYVTPEIVSTGTLTWLGYGAINFHPGPPDYPGWAPAHFELYERATEFGARAGRCRPYHRCRAVSDPTRYLPSASRGSPMATSRNCSGRSQNGLPPTPARRRRCRSNAVAKNIRAAPTGRSAAFRSTCQGRA